MTFTADQAVGSGKEVEILGTIYVRVRAKVIGHESQSLTYAIGIVHTGKPVHTSVAVGRQVERGENPHARRLAGAIRADVAEYFPARYGERYVVDRPRVAKKAMQSMELDHGVRGDHGFFQTPRTM